MTSEHGDAAQRRRRPSAEGRGTRRTRAGRSRRIAATACSVQCFVQCRSPSDRPPRPSGSPRSPPEPSREDGSAPFPARTVFGRRRAPLIDRYALPEIAGLFTDEARFRAWLEVEILAVEAWAKLGVVPAADAVAIRERADFDVADDRRAGAGHRARRRRLRRRGAGAHRCARPAPGSTTASRRATSSTPPSR